MRICITILRLNLILVHWEPQHPPLARVATALLPYLIGLRSANTPHDRRFAMSVDGAAILYSGGHYDRNLALARLGILPFFWQPRLASSCRRSRGQNLLVCAGRVDRHAGHPGGIALCGRLPRASFANIGSMRRS